jgi:all-trans-retinol dehydrogenase (NAD+)
MGSQRLAASAARVKGDGILHASWRGNAFAIRHDTLRSAPMKNLKGKLVLITGAAHGLGKSLAFRLTKEGARVIVTDVREAELRATADELRASGGTAFSFPLDVTDPAAIAATRTQIHNELGRIDVLVNNAGVVFGGPFLEVSLEKHRLTYGVNTLGLVAMTHAFLPDLIARGEGHLVNIASASGLMGLVNGATYASSKWSVIGFSESIRLELAELRYPHVKVTTVCPSYVATGMFSGAKMPFLSPVLTPEGLVHKIALAIHEDEPMVLEPPIVLLFRHASSIFSRIDLA